MRKAREPLDYEPVRGPSRSRAVENPDDWNLRSNEEESSSNTQPSPPSPATNLQGRRRHFQGHGLSYIGLLLFTVVTYFRPQEFFSSLATTQLALFVAIATLFVYLPTQLSLQGNFTEPLREVNLLLLLTLLALLSIPFGISPPDALNSLWEFLKATIVFVLIVNVVHTERRLKGMFLIAMAVTCTLAVGALNDYRLGNLTVEGYRVQGIIKGGMFENPNDLGIHLATMFPLSFALALGSRRILSKVLFGFCALLALSASVVTFSRGNFLGLVAASIVLAWKLSRRGRARVILIVIVGVVLFAAMAPPSYWVRVASIWDSRLDAFGSSSMRGELLKQSFLVTLRHPLIGVGIGNFTLMSIRSLVSHNSYTQVGAELGAFALLIYAMFIVAPFRRLSLIERETLQSPKHRWYYFLSVGLQASLVAYMVSSFFASVAFYWFVYYLVGYAICLRHIYAESKLTIGAPKEQENWKPQVQASTPLNGAKVPTVS